MVADLLHSLGYSLQGNRKTKEGSNHPDRNAQFEHLNGKVKWSLCRRQPVISVNTKKKELVGDFSNKGQEWRPKGDPENVRVYDFLDKELGRATPFLHGFTAIEGTNNGFGQDARSANDGAARYLAGYPFDQAATCPIDFCAGIGAHHEFTIRSKFTGFWLKFCANADAGWKAGSPERARRNFVLPCGPRK